MQVSHQMLRLAVFALASTSLVACSSSGSDPVEASGELATPVVVGSNDNDATPAIDNTGDNSVDTPVQAPAPAPVPTPAPAPEPAPETNPEAGGEAENEGEDTTADNSSDADNNPDESTDTVAEQTQPLDDEVPPALPDPFAAPIPGPPASDFFNTRLEVDTEEAVAGGPPTTPKNLRVDLISNDWAEINWAPSNDDGEVVAYNVYRSDGVVYEVERDGFDPNRGTQAEIDKFFATTAFIDCNFTRFFDRVHNCSVNQPIPGETYNYQVTAVDDEGQESPRSNPITITYHLERGAPVPRYEDPFLDGSDFAQRNDLSETRFFLDEFDVMFEDEFTGTEIDENKWTTGLVWGDTRIINGEQQYFVNTQEDPLFGYDPFTLTGDSLIIEAIPVPDELRGNLPPVCDETDETGLDRCEFLSGAISSHLQNGNINGGHKYGFIYGYMESRLKVSGTPGALSSNYLYHRFPGEGINRHGPEIDIIEYLGENPFGAEDAFQTYHYQDPESGVIRSAPTMSFANPDGSLYSDDFHTYGVLWEPSLVIWYIDGVEIQRLSGPQVSRQPMNIVNYLVAGSAWAPTPADDPSIYPIQFEVDYIRVMQREAYQGTSSIFDPEIHGEL